MYNKYFCCHAAVTTLLLITGWGWRDEPIGEEALCVWQQVFVWVSESATVTETSFFEALENKHTR